MWWAFTDQGTLLYPEFIETVTRLIPFYWVRALGGTMYLVGMVLCAINVFQTVLLAGKEKLDLSDTEASAAPLKPSNEKAKKGQFHHWLEGKALPFSLLVTAGVLLGGPAEFIPMVAIKGNIKTIESVKPYTPLELEGRDVYIREGCYNCHSQQVRPFRDEALRYGEYSKAGEFVYDHPFQFGSKRTGPDLHRVGGKYPDFWHYRHMEEPTSTTPGSLMPPYRWLYQNELDTSKTSKKLTVMRSLGVPYSDQEVDNAVADLNSQAKTIVDRLKSQGVTAKGDLQKKEIIALIAYLQRLGTDIKAK
jgi:cytochrome c oxidase cbb3-type subunit I/II